MWDPYPWELMILSFTCTCHVRNCAVGEKKFEVSAVGGFGVYFGLHNKPLMKCCWNVFLLLSPVGGKVMLLGELHPHLGFLLLLT